MKLSAIVAGLAAALTAVGAARAGTMGIFYRGKGDGARLELDGKSYELNEDWVDIAGVNPGTHTLTLYANGGGMTRELTLSTENAATTGGDDPPGWCVDLEDDAVNILDSDDCDDMLDEFAVYSSSK